MTKLFGLDGSTVRQIQKLFALDGSTPRRVKKLFSNDGGTVRLVYEDASTFTVSGTANPIVSPTNEVVEFGLRDDFDAGGADVSVNASGSGDTSNVGGISGLSIDVDSNHTFSSTTTVNADPSDSNGANCNTVNGSVVGISSRAMIVNGSGTTTQQMGRGTSILDGRYESTSKSPLGFGHQTNDLTRMQGTFAIGTFTTGSGIGPVPLVNPHWKTISENGGATSITVTLGGTTYTARCATSRTANASNNANSNYVNSMSWEDSAGFFGRRTLMAMLKQSPFNQASDGLAYFQSQGFRFLNPGFASYNMAHIWYVPGYSTTTTVSGTGRRARVQNGSNRPFNVTGGGLTAGNNFATGSLSAGASTGFITADSTSEAFTLTGTGTKNPATFSIANADNSITVSGTFADGENATQARTRIKNALNGNGTFTGKFNTGSDSNGTRSGVAHKIVTFTSDNAENTEDFTITITANDGSNTTPHHSTVTQGAAQSLQTSVQLNREVSGSAVSTTTSIASSANTDTAGAAVASNSGADVTYDSSTNKLKVQDQDATISVSNAGSLGFSKD